MYEISHKHNLPNPDPLYLSSIYPFQLPFQDLLEEDFRLLPPELHGRCCWELDLKVFPLLLLVKDLNRSLEEEKIMKKERQER